jgi:hypothetical protein
MIEHIHLYFFRALSEDLFHVWSRSIVEQYTNVLDFLDRLSHFLPRVADRL